MKYSKSILLILSAATFLVGCQRKTENVQAANLHEITSPAGEGSGQANLAVGPDGQTYLSWIEYTDSGSPALKFAVKKADGWADPHVIFQSDDLIVNYADFPSILALGNNAFAAHWMSQIPGAEEGYNVNIAVSRDGGQTWSKPVTPHRDGTPTEHGFVSMAPDPSGGVSAVWFDSRKLNGQTGSDDVAMMTAHINPDGTAGTEMVVDDRVCECCQSSAINVPGGVLVAYRDRSKDEIRDTAIVRFDGHQWSQPKTVFADNWEIAACPINGPALAANGQNVAVAWFTVANDKPKVKLSFSSDGGNTFGQPVEIDDGNAMGRVDVVMLESGGAVVSWLEKTAQGAEVRARAAQPDGTRQPSLLIGSTGAGTMSGFPRMKRSGETIVFAWKDTSQDKVRTAALELNK